MKLTTLILACVAITIATTPTSSAPLGTGITYQGVLTDAGAPLTGTADLRFRLFDAATGGTELGLVSIDDLVVTDGRVTAVLDFGDQFDGNARWLQVEVRDGASTGAYDVLPSRQALSATPLGLFAVGVDHAVAADHATTVGSAATLDGEPGAHYRDFANLTALPPGLSDGDQDTAAAMSCSAGEMPTWNGSAWVCDPDDGFSYARTAVVGPVGAATDNGAALLAAVTALPTPTSQDEGWLVHLEPGLYDLGTSSLRLPPWVTLHGAGELVSVVTSSVCGDAPSTTATIVGSDFTELRDLTVENTCGSHVQQARAIAFGTGHDATRLSRVTARTFGGALGCVAVLHRSPDAVLDRVTAQVTGCGGDASGIAVSGSDALLLDCIASADGAGEGSGLSIGARAWVSRGAFSAVDTPGQEDTAIVVDANADLQDITATCADAAVRVRSSGNWIVAFSRLIATGPVVAVDEGGALLLVVEHSRILSAGATVIGDTNAAIGVGMTQLAGGAVSPSGGLVACAGIWDEFWTPYANTCP